MFDFVLYKKVFSAKFKYIFFLYIYNIWSFFFISKWILRLYSKTLLVKFYLRENCLHIISETRLSHGILKFQQAFFNV